ncbi:glycosyltransferase family A protein [Pedobacter cryoconitis]|uniref:Glycosyl transferase family 2 n=1 Tax=Pedobacter cryoconitis TaxID=188932 RepID=A0A7X0MLA4_9SPHI|nr:glycosyltransferase family A protein [Pedobacter cryoconitis]MBB6501213.1 hypothetical protein [Pedobacter cryoconitis]
MGSIANYGYYNVILWKKNNRSRYCPKNILSLELDAEDYDYLLFLKFDSDQSYLIPNIENLIASIELIYDQNQTSFVVLTSRKDPPLYTASEDELVYSFSCKFQYFKKLVGSLNKTNHLSTDLLFQLLDKISKDNSDYKGILIRQIPFEVNSVISISDYDVIIPHRGDNQYLRNALSFLPRTGEAEIFVGIDQGLTKDLFQLKNDYTDVSFYNFKPNPVGPYVIRNRLIDLSDNKLIFFQDSDDMPCSDRFERISDYMRNHDCQLCGSHELRLDYYNRTVQSVRFPLDVTSALNSGPWHSLLHPTSAITRKAFYECGRLSEERIFGNDTKFLLNSFFTLKSIKNINEFLYIRKRHPGSLTTSPETMIGSTIRKKLGYTWSYDFELIKNGALKLENSSLKYEGSKLVFEVKKL